MKKHFKYFSLIITLLFALIVNTMPCAAQEVSKKAERLYQKAVKQKDIDDPKVYEISLIKAAKAGHPEAEYDLGKYYYKYSFFTIAIEWYTKAAEKGHTQAQFELGNIYYLGKIVTRDYHKAFKWYIRAAEKGHTQAQFELGNCYYYGNGVTQNYHKAIEWYTKAVENGHNNAKQRIANAQYGIGNNYYKAQDYEKAIEWYTKATVNGYSSARQGIANAQYEIGNNYYKAQNYEKAIEWYSKAVENGHSSARQDIANAQYEIGNNYYKAQNYEKAIEWYSKATVYGHSSAREGIAKIYCDTGDNYYYGRGVAQDYHKAIEWYTKAIKYDNKATQAISNAQFEIGYNYQIGRGVAKDYNKAIEWYQKAAENGNEDAFIELGEYYYMQNNLDLAEEYYEKANCDEGLGKVLYKRGELCYAEKDYESALEYYTEAEELGFDVPKEKITKINQKKGFQTKYYKIDMERGSASYKASIEYPQQGPQSLVDNIRSYICSDLQSHANIGYINIDSDINSVLNSDAKRFVNELSNTGFTEYKIIEIYSLKRASNCICYRFYYNENRLEYKHFLNFEYSTGDVLEVEDVFNLSYERQIFSLIDNYTQGETCRRMGITQLNEIKFAITSEVIIFNFTDGFRTGYANVPLSKIKPYLTTRGKNLIN